ncbi:MAG: hypothetical protein EXX96DRAFT_169122 [Benjaminiella poitrasii]|nr:MAG: hypothetical protein EXX96DRAFT_169122 [Benjaminiella poitrasii]
MVARQPHSRRASSNGSSVAYSSSRSRHRSSLRKQSEKTITSSSISARNTESQKRFKSISEDILQQEQMRRPSESASVDTPRLSIADRFMSKGYVSPASTTSQQSTLKNSSSSSNLSDTQTTSSKLSVADRFMNTRCKSPTNSMLSAQLYQERTGSISAAKSVSTKTSNLSSPTTTLKSINSQMPGRLTIADAFMKTSSTNLNLISNESLTDEFDSKAINNRKPSQIHPLDTQPTKLSFFDSTNSTQLLNLDLSLSSTSQSGSVNLGRNNSRPWGSQDTLVHSQYLEKKKYNHCQFSETEKTNNRPLSFNNYFMDSNTFAPTTNDDYSVVDMGNAHMQKYNRYYQQGQPHWSYQDEDEENIEKKSYYEQDSPLGATNKLNNKKNSDDGDKSRGFWIGCCFISCGKKPSREAFEERKWKREQQRKSQQQSKGSRRGCGRRGWVFCTFLTLIVFVLVTYFLWPRTPLMRIEGASLTSATKVSETKQGVMVGNVAFESEWLVNVTIDNRQNHIPTRLVKVQVIAKDALTGLIIGKGVHNDDPSPEHIVLAPDSISNIQLPIRVDYQARDSTDTTFVDLVKACSPKHPILFNTSSDSGSNQDQREALPLHFWITLHFFGLDWLGYKPTVIATPATGGFACPLS